MQTSGGSISASAPSQRKNSASRPASNTEASSGLGARNAMVPSQRGKNSGSVTTRSRRVVRTKRPGVERARKRRVLADWTLNDSREPAIVGRNRLAVRPEKRDLALDLARSVLHCAER